jgi:hypothetical protein
MDLYGDLLQGDMATRWREAVAEAKRKADEARKARTAQEHARTAQEKRKRAQREAEELRLQYTLWRSAWEADITRKKSLTLFPQMPIRYCTCREIACMSRKLDTGLLACEHDMEVFLRADEQYSVAWLRRERLLWHPDRFGARCDPDFRKELIRKATEMYAIFESLIA